MSGGNGWICYRVVFQAEAPVHIGWHDLGTVQRTRCYIPARNLWAVLVAGIAPALPRDPDGRVDYAAAKTEVEQTARVSCFFLAASENGSGSRLPRFVDGPFAGLYYGDCHESDLEAQLLSSQTSAALDPSRLSAEEGALHESEFLSPRRNWDRVFYAGYVLARNTLTRERLETIYRTCSVGADRRYGWGRLRLRTFEPYAGPLFEALHVSEWLPGEDPVLRWTPAGAVRFSLPAHLLLDDRSAAFRGEIEPLSGRDWSQQGSGKDIVMARPCWAPGSYIPADGRCTPWQFSIEPEGIWSVKL